MKFSELKKHLAGGAPKGVYIIEGDDAFLREKAEAMLSAAAVSGFSELNLIRLTTANPQLISEALAALPFMSDGRAAVIREYYPKAAEAESVSKLNFADTQCVLIISNASRSELNKRIPHTFIDCSREDLPVLEKWVAALVRAGGAEIGQSAASLLAQYCGRDMGRINSEAQKLLMLGEPEVTQAMIEKNVSKDTEYQVYMLANAVASRSGDPYGIIKDFALKGDSGYIQLLLMSLYAQFKRMFYVKNSRLREGELSEKLNIKPYAVTMAAKAAKNYDKAKLKKAMALCADADYKIKSGKMTGENALYFVIASLLERGV